jgi:hypothetical protein
LVFVAERRRTVPTDPNERKELLSFPCPAKEHLTVGTMGRKPEGFREREGDRRLGEGLQEGVRKPKEHGGDLSFRISRQGKESVIADPKGDPSTVRLYRLKGDF